MVRVLAVNNYPDTERFERLRRCLEENGARVTSADWRDSSVLKFDGFDGIALSGPPDMLSRPKTQKKYATEMEAIVETKAPILGVCFGHQMIAVAFGAKVVNDGRRILEFVRTKALSEDPLFSGLPRSMMLLESRREVVESLPVGFDQIASSATSKIAAMKHRKLPLYGVQFHPERYTTENPDGKTVAANFVRMLS